MLTNVWLEVEAVNSVQNGLLLAASMHQLFDNFQILVNPEDLMDIRLLILVPTTGMRTAEY
ncbi:hypothetical protein AAEP93_008351 [Penicillium crustosum]